MPHRLPLHRAHVLANSLLRNRFRALLTGGWAEIFGSPNDYGGHRIVNTASVNCEGERFSFGGPNVVRNQSLAGRPPSANLAVPSVEQRMGVPHRCGALTVLLDRAMDVWTPTTCPFRPSSYGFAGLPP